MTLVNNINQRITRNVIVPSKAIRKKALAVPEEFEVGFKEGETLISNDRREPILS